MNNYREESSCTLTEQTSRVPLHMVGGPDVPFSGSTRDPLALASVCLSACLSCRASGKFALWLRNMQPLSSICKARATKVAPQDGARNRLLRVKDGAAALVALRLVCSQPPKRSQISRSHLPATQRRRWRHGIGCFR